MAKALGRGSVWRIALRSAGVLIAIAAAIDPAITSTRNSRPLVSVAAIDASADSAVAVQVARALRDDAQVVPALFGRADATVLVGNDVPHDQDDLATPVFVVRDDSRPQLNIRTVRAPTRASVHSRVHIQVDVQARGARGRELDVVLRAGAIAVDRHRVTITSDDTVASVPLSFAPTLAGAAALRVEAILVGANSVSTTASPTRALADLLVAVTTQPLAVLVYDSRPSWMSTFVRRALERDLRLVVTSRVVTSRSISTSAGSAPERLDELASMARFDAIVVAPRNH